MKQAVLRKQSFVDTTQCSMHCKTWHPDFRHDKSKLQLWLDNRLKPVWVDSESTGTNAALKRSSVSGCTSLQEPGPFEGIGSYVEFQSCRILCEDGALSDAVDALHQMVWRGCHVPNNLFYRVLKRSMLEANLALGRRIHTLIVKSGYEGDTFLATHLMGFYAVHGRLEEAMGVFTRLSTPDAYNWATIIFAYARHGETTEAAKAVRLYRQMCQSTAVKPDNRLYVAVLKACAVAKDLVTGKEVHARILASSGKPDKYVQAGLVNMYAKCGGLEDARRVFDKLSDKNVVTWTTMIAGYAHQGMGQETLALYRSMQHEGFAPNCVTYACLLQACASVGVGALHEGKRLHAEVKERGLQENLVLGGALISMYAKCGSLEDARSVFETLPKKNLVAWNTMIAGFSQQGLRQDALSLFRRMQQEGLTPNGITYVCLLQSCAHVGVGALGEGKRLHAQIKEQGLEEDGVLGGSLVHMYVKCGSLEGASFVFSKLSKKDAVAWTMMIAGYAQYGKGQEALSLYNSMRQDGVAPDRLVYASLLQACAGVGARALAEGRQLHAEIKEQGLQNDLVFGGSLVNMYVKCGSISHARRLFDKLPERNVVAWNAMIAGYAQQGMGQEALSLHSCMQHEALFPNSVTYVSLLQACANVGVEALGKGKQLHAEIEERGLDKDVHLLGSLVNMYVKCDSLEDARSVLDNYPEKNVVAWNAMMAGYSQHGMGQDALSLYRSMQDKGPAPNAVTYACLLQACASSGVKALRDGRQLHAKIKELGMEEDVVVGSSLVNMLVKLGRLEEARIVFDKLTNRDVVTWNGMIAGYAQQGTGEEVLSLYGSMQREGLSPNCATYVSLLQACASAGVRALCKGKQLHAEIVERGLQEDFVVGSSLVNMYAKCGSLDYARRLFDKLKQKDVAAWNSMIAGYTQQGMGEEALCLYASMKLEEIYPNSVTYVCLLQACADVGVGALCEGKELHVQIEERGLEKDAVVGSSLVNMYVKCGSFRDACSLFYTLPEKNVVAWTTMVTACAQQEMGHEALSLYTSMQRAGLTPDAVTYTCILQACAAEAALPLGKQVHVEIKESGVQADGMLGTALVNMYAKCGSMYHSQEVFDSMADRSIETWSALVSGYARQGDSQVVFDLLERMKLEGVRPNGVTFLSVLLVCSHAGLVNKGKEYFEGMRRDYGISATMEHYICMVDLLGRAGHLDEALEMVKTMPFPPNAAIWFSMLGNFRKWKNGEIDQQASKEAVSVG